MMNRVSAFFANFSLRELVKNKLHLPPSNPERASRSAAGGGFLCHGQFLYSKSESFPCPVYASDFVSFDEQGFIIFLKAEVEKEIIDSAAAITGQGKIEGNFNSSEFYFEYTQEGIKGRIIISGKMVGSGYYLAADLEEISEGAEFPFAAGEFRSQSAGLPCATTVFGGSPFAPDEFRRGKPEGDFYVVPFMKDDPLAKNDIFLYIGAEMIKASRERITRGVTNEPAKDLQYVEVWSVINIPPQVKEILRERGVERNDEEPEEYKEYEKVYFLNELALRMYREGGITLDPLKKVSGAEMPKRCNCNLRGPYIPR